MISAYGPRATAYVARLGEIEAIVTEPDWIGQAYLEAVRRRELGHAFYGLVLVDDPRLTFGYKHGEEILSQCVDYDQRRWVVEQLVTGGLPINGKRADSVWPTDPALENIIVEFLWLCDALLVRSFAEYERIVAMHARHPNPRPLHAVERVLAAASVPAPERVRPQRPGIVVWAPSLTAIECALALHGLAEVHGEVTCVSAGGALPSYCSATFVTAGEAAAAAALGRAAAVVCLDPSDPSDAVAFARLGYGVAAPFTSGAHEFAVDVVPYDALDVAFLFTAAAIAIARPASINAEPERPPPVPLVAGLPEFARTLEPPLVSIVTPTYNRREELRRMLSCLAAQTYPNIEAVVVNDGGEAVDDIVAEFPFARLIDQRSNAGALRATLVGWETASGEYIGLLPDDDWLYPDHVERLMNALLRSGAAIAHGAGLLRYLERLESGAWISVGFNASVFCQTLAESDALVSSTIGGHQMLAHRSVYENLGWYDLDSDISDNEMHARMTKRYSYAFSDHVTAEFRDHPGGQGRRCDFPAAMRHMYTELHPVKDRPTLDAIREWTIANVARREPGASAFAASIRIRP